MSGTSQAAACRPFLALLLREGDGELLPADEARLRGHLSSCAPCAREAERRSQIGLLLRRDPLPMDQVRLPTGEELARSVVEAAHSRPRTSGFPTPWAGWAAGAIAGLAVLLFAVRAPAPPATTTPSSSTAPISAPPGFWIDDDEQTGRTVLMESRPARSGAR